jgi:hypothetical protein
MCNGLNCHSLEHAVMHAFRDHVGDLHADARIIVEEASLRAMSGSISILLVKFPTGLAVLVG